MLNNWWLIVEARLITILQGELVTMLLRLKGSITIRRLVLLMHTGGLGIDLTQASHLIVRFACILHRHLLLWMLWKVTDFNFTLLFIITMGIGQESPMQKVSIIVFQTFNIIDRIHLVFLVILAVCVGIKINELLIILNILFLAIFLWYLHFQIVRSHLSKTFLFRSKFIKLQYN